MKKPMPRGRSSASARPHRITLRLSARELAELHKTSAYTGLDGSGLLRLLLRKAFHEIAESTPKEPTP